MTITDDARSDLYQHAKEAMGERAAGTLMAHLPPVGWADVATKQDLEHLRVATKQDLEHLRVATKQDIETLRLDTTKEFDHLREVTTVRFDAMEKNFDTIQKTMVTEAELHKALRNTVLFMVGTNITLFGLAVATVRWAA